MCSCPATCFENNRTHARTHACERPTGASSAGPRRRRQIGAHADLLRNRSLREPADRMRMRVRAFACVISLTGSEAHRRQPQAEATHAKRPPYIRHSAACNAKQVHGAMIIVARTRVRMRGCVCVCVRSALCTNCTNYINTRDSAITGPAHQHLSMARAHGVIIHTRAPQHSS